MNCNKLLIVIVDHDREFCDIFNMRLNKVAEKKNLYIDTQICPDIKSAFKYISNNSHKIDILFINTTIGNKSAGELLRELETERINIFTISFSRHDSESDVARLIINYQIQYHIKVEKTTENDKDEDWEYTIKIDEYVIPDLKLELIIEKYNQYMNRDFNAIILMLNNINKNQIKYNNYFEEKKLKKTKRRNILTNILIDGIIGPIVFVLFFASLLFLLKLILGLPTISEVLKKLFNF